MHHARHALFLLLVPLAVATGSPAQHEPPDTFGHSRHGAAFDEGPRQLAYLMQGMSEQVHLPVAGLSAHAQALFDQGITQLHGFWYFEAERSFRHVAWLHPDCAMAYWGMTLANLESVERAVGFIAQAVRRSADLPRYEQRWIDAWAAYYLIDDAARTELRSGDDERVKQAIAALVAKNADRPKAKKQKLDKQLLKALGGIVHEFPDDLEAKALLAVQIWHASDWGSGIEIVSHTAVDALLDQVFDRAPQHPAHHYRVHLWDRESAERALASAAALGDSAPGIAHQWHMAGHIYAKLHRHAEAAWQQQASARVDHAHMHRDRVMPFLIHNYGHNQEWLVRSLSLQGRVDEALAAARNLAELPRHPEANRVGKSGDIAWYARLRLISLCEEHRMWEELLRLHRDGHLDASDDAAGEAMRIGALARAAFRLGRRDEAERFAAEADALLPKARAERARAIDEAEDEALAAGKESKEVDEALEAARRRGTDVVRAALDLQQELAAERLLADGDAQRAAAALKEIRGFPKVLLADAYLAAGDHAAAIELLAKEVAERPKRFPTLARLVLAYRAAKAPEHADALRAREAELAAMPGASGPLAAELGLPAPRPVTVADFPDDFGPRPELASLGPADWMPQSARPLALPVAGGGRRALHQQRGKPTLVVFYLGFGCLHCVEQLQALAPKAADFAAAGIDILAVGTDTPEQAGESLAAMSEEERFPFPLLADPELVAFKEWRCFDHFEDMPLHGTFLVDAEGRVRWQDVSYEPFTELDWLLAESRRLLALGSVAGAGAGTAAGIGAGTGAGTR